MAIIGIKTITWFPQDLNQNANIFNGCNHVSIGNYNCKRTERMEEHDNVKVVWKEKECYYFSWTMVAQGYVYQSKVDVYVSLLSRSRKNSSLLAFIW